MWRDISTAPRDGTEILVYGQFAGEVNGIDSPYKIGVAYYNGGRTDYPDFTWAASNTDAYAGWWKPAHWKPLPEPPNA